MPKMDAKFQGLLTKVKDGTVVPDDQYIVFLVKDTSFFETIPYYLLRCMKNNCDRAQIDAVYRMYWRARAWREANPDKVKYPDAEGEKLLDL